MSKICRHRSCTRLIPVLLALIILAGCSRNPLEKISSIDTKKLTTSIESTTKIIRAEQEKYDKLSASDKFFILAPYAAKRQWKETFARADAMVERARDLFKNDYKPFIKTGGMDQQSMNTAKAKFKQIDSQLNEAKDTARRVLAEIGRLQGVIANADTIAPRALNAAKNIPEQVKVLEEGPVARAKKDFPGVTDKINARFARFSKMADEARANAAVINAQYKAHKAGNADYLAFMTAADSLEKAEKELPEAAKNFQEALQQLGMSYSIILEDMKMEYVVVVRREVWNEYNDYQAPDTTDYYRKVSPKWFETIGESDAEYFADIAPGSGSLHVRPAPGFESMYKYLGVDPTKKWPGNAYNSGVLYVDRTEVHYFHKYLQEIDGKTQSLDWSEVKASYYEESLNNLGLSVATKPYGEFEPDLNPSPPGLGYVDDAKYGEWKTDEKGDQFWSWYGRYAFFSTLFFYPPYHYHYNTWNHWRTDYRYKQPYYGNTPTGYMFGSRGEAMKSSPRFQNTTFSKTGGLKAAQASVRGAASGLRGGGPNSKGK